MTQTSPAQPSRPRPKGQDGYTLIEMLVVLTIISLIVGLIGPRVLNYPAIPA